jgi:magnesium transporter
MPSAKRSQKSGLPPGTLVHVGEASPHGVHITLMDYDTSHFTEKALENVDQCAVYRKSPNVTWINIIGLSDTASIEKLGACFGLHPLILEDIVNTQQRPKVEDYGSYLYIVLRMLSHHGDSGAIKSEQVSLVLGENFVLSFQEEPGDVWDSVRGRLRNDRGRIRKAGADYLTYALMDTVVDNYFIILEKSGEKIEDIEDELINSPSREVLPSIYQLKREMIDLRRSVWPLRETVNSLLHSENKLISDSTRLFFRDIYDHTIQVIDTIESFRDLVSGMLDIYLSSTSNRLNEIMKVLTIITVIFIPLTLVTGIYGMNFEFMPELGWRWGYPAVLVFLLISASLMLLFFKRKKWF